MRNETVTCEGEERDKYEESRIVVMERDGKEMDYTMNPMVVVCIMMKESLQQRTD